MADTLVAHPGEVRKYTWDFSLFPEVVAGDTLTGTPTITASPAGLTIGSPSISGPRVTALITVGAATASYLTVCAAATAGGSTLECLGRLEVTL